LSPPALSDGANPPLLNPKTGVLPEPKTGWADGFGRDLSSDEFSSFSSSWTSFLDPLPKPSDWIIGEDEVARFPKPILDVAPDPKTGADPDPKGVDGACVSFSFLSPSFTPLPKPVDWPGEDDARLPNPTFILDAVLDPNTEPEPSAVPNTAADVGGGFSGEEDDVPAPPNAVAVTPNADPNVALPVEPNESPPDFPEPNAGSAVVLVGVIRVPPKLNDGAENPEANPDVGGELFARISSSVSSASLSMESKDDAESLLMSLSSSCALAALCLPLVTLSNPRSSPERMHLPLSVASDGSFESGTGATCEETAIDMLISAVTSAPIFHGRTKNAPPRNR